jgi:hypothetical protein
VEEERTKQKEQELLIEQERTKQMQSRRFAGTYSRSPSGLHTPSTPGGSKSAQEHRSPGYYFDELKQHFYSVNLRERYAITMTRFRLDIYAGRDSIYDCQSTGVDVRNVYIMLSVCDYDVGQFLKNLRSGTFGEGFTTVDKSTPPKFNQRLNVYAPTMGT